MARCQRGSTCDCTILCRPTAAAAVAAVAGVPRSGGAAELVVRPAVLSSCTTPAAPVSTTGSKCAKRLGRPNDRGSWTDVGRTGIDGADGGAAVSDVDHRRWERGRKRRKSTNSNSQERGGRLETWWIGRKARSNSSYSPIETFSFMTRLDRLEVVAALGP